MSQSTFRGQPRDSPGEPPHPIIVGGLEPPAIPLGEPRFGPLRDVGFGRGEVSETKPPLMSVRSMLVMRAEEVSWGRPFEDRVEGGGGHASGVVVVEDRLG